VEFVAVLLATNSTNFTKTITAIGCHRFEMWSRTAEIRVAAPRRPWLSGSIMQEKGL